MAKKTGMKKKINFSGVTDGGSVRVKPGEYIGKVVSAEIKSGDKGEYINWKIEIISGGSKEAKGKTIYNNTSLAPQALFNVRNMLLAMGFDVPKKSIEIDFSKCVGKTVGIIVEDDKYEGKTRSIVVEYFGAKKNKKGVWEKTEGYESEESDDDADDDDDDDEDDDDDDEDDDDDDADDDDEEEPAAKKKTGKKKEKAPASKKPDKKKKK